MIFWYSLAGRTHCVLPEYLSRRRLHQALYNKGHEFQQVLRRFSFIQGLIQAPCYQEACCGHLCIHWEGLGDNFGCITDSLGWTFMKRTTICTGMCIMPPKAPDPTVVLRPHPDTFSGYTSDGRISKSLTYLKAGFFPQHEISAALSATLHSHCTKANYNAPC